MINIQKLATWANVISFLFGITTVMDFIGLSLFSLSVSMIMALLFGTIGLIGKGNHKELSIIGILLALFFSLISWILLNPYLITTA